MRRRTLLASAGGLAAAGWFTRAKADTPGVTATEIRIGNTCPHSGPASAYGALADNNAAYFRMVNDEGGVGGRKINFISLDDAYSPPRTVEQTRRLVEEEGVAFIFNGLGTACQTAVRQYMNDRKVPQLFVLTGADKFDDPNHYPWTMGFQPSYRTEATIYAKHLMAQKPDAKLGVLYQNDDFGKDYLTGVKKGLGDSYARIVVKEVSYETTDPTVDSQIISLHAAGADALLTAATPKWAAQSIRKIADLGWKPLHFLANVSASVGAVITPAGSERAVGIITAAYYKDPNDPAWQDDPGMNEWRTFMKKYMPTADTTNGLYLNGHLLGAAVVQVLRQCGDDLSRASIMRQAANLHDFKSPVLVPGITANTSPTNFQAIRSMRLSRFDGASWVLFGPVIST
jgi:branched-chain amino acid transport system substrate-binding protein